MWGLLAQPKVHQRGKACCRAGEVMKALYKAYPESKKGTGMLASTSNSITTVVNLYLKKLDNNVGNKQIIIE